MPGKELIRLASTRSEETGEIIDLAPRDVLDVLDDLVLSGSGQEHEDAIIRVTGRTGVYDITNSVFGTRLVIISEAFPQASSDSDYPGDC
jgi:hypothetical protein